MDRRACGKSEDGWPSSFRFHQDFSKGPPPKNQEVQAQMKGYRRKNSLFCRFWGAAAEFAAGRTWRAAPEVPADLCWTFSSWGWQVGGLGSCLPPSVQDEQAVHDLRRGDAVRHGERPVAQEALTLGQVRAGRLPAESQWCQLWLERPKVRKWSNRQESLTTFREKKHFIKKITLFKCNHSNKLTPI